jgi:Tfp pilus assembly protein PilX
MSNLALKRHLAGQSGFILPTAIIVLFILALLTGVAINVSVQTSSSTTRDDNTKAALAAAEAGLRVATYRLGALRPSEAQCITANAVGVPTGGYCEDASAENLGNGATFQYWTTPALKAGETCAGQVVEIQAGFTQRCVTSQGKVNGISQRVSARVESVPGEKLFPVKGIVGLSEVKISGSVKVPAVVASNGKIIGEGSAAFELGFELCAPGGEFKPKAGSERNSSGVTVHKVGGMESAGPEWEKTRLAAECSIKAPLPAGHASEASNEDARIGVSDKLEGTTTWTGAPNYELTLAANGKLTLEGSKYYFCNFNATSNSKLIIAAAAKVEIFIDSPEDKASKCKEKSGKFTGSNAFVVENLTKNPADLLIEAYGKGPVELLNGAKLEGSIYAPEGEVNINGGTSFKGGIVGNKVHLEAGAGIFEWSEEVGSLTNGEAGSYKRKGWEQCKPGSGGKEGC